VRHLDTQRTEPSQEHVDRLAAIAVQLVERVRDDNPQANLRWLLAQLPDENDRLQLAFVLAAAVPTDRPWSHLTAWARHRASARAA
jgi:hypothetical protein